MLTGLARFEMPEEDRVAARTSSPSRHGDLTPSHEGEAAGGEERYREQIEALYEGDTRRGGGGGVMEAGEARGSRS